MLLLWPLISVIVISVIILITKPSLKQGIWEQKGGGRERKHFKQNKSIYQTTHSHFALLVFVYVKFLVYIIGKPKKNKKTEDSFNYLASDLNDKSVKLYQ